MAHYLQRRRILPQAVSPETQWPRGRAGLSESAQHDADPQLCAVAIDDVRNAIFQRLRDTIRRGGSNAYQEAINGLSLGVDLRGNTMNGFLGIKVLSELLIMGRVGVYVDSPEVPGNATLADVKGVPPVPVLLPHRRHSELDLRQAG